MMGLPRRFTPRNDGENGRHCERNEVKRGNLMGLLRRFAPRNDGLFFCFDFLSFGFWISFDI
jgi:hypothetical protein